MQERLRDGLAGRAPDLRAGRDEVLDDRRAGAVLQRHQRPGDDRPAGDAGGVTQDERALERDAGGDAEVDPRRPGRARELRHRVVGREAATALEERASRGRIARDERGEGLQHDARVAGRSREDGDGGVPFADLDEAVRALGKARVATGDGGRRIDIRHDLLEVGLAQVHIERVEAVRLDRELGVAREAGEPVRDEPLGLGRGGGARRDGGLGRVRERKVGGPAARGPRLGGDPACGGACGAVRDGARRPRGGRLDRAVAAGVPAGRRPVCGPALVGCAGHPRDPSISSFTSRLNSMAYSIGSSFVKTSRNPCTTMFVASFSVRPRLMR